MSFYKGNVLIAGSLPVPPSAMTYSGTCLQSELPISGQTVGNYYKLADETGIYKGQCAIWNKHGGWDYSSSNLTIDKELDENSINPVENGVVTKAIKKKADKLTTYTKTEVNELLQGFYDGMHPVNSIVFGFQAPGVPIGITATWTDVSSSYENRYFKISSSSAIGTSEAENLPKPTINSVSAHSHSYTPSGSIGNAGDHSHNRGTMNITGTFAPVVTDRTDWGATYHNGCFEYSSYWGKDGPSGMDGARAWLNFDASRGWSGSTNTTGSHNHSFTGTASSTGDAGGHNHSIATSGPYNDSGAVRPLTTTIKAWKRTA